MGILTAFGLHVSLYQFLPLVGYQRAASQPINMFVIGAGKMQEWMEAINAGCLNRLQELSPNFKFISSTIILQKTGAGLHYDCASHWDIKTDGVVTSKFENDTIIGINTVFVLAL